MGDVDSTNTSLLNSNDTTLSLEEKDIVQNVEASTENQKEHGNPFEEKLNGLSHTSKEDLIKLLKELNKQTTDFKNLRSYINTIKARFNAIYETEKNEALQKFVTEGNDANDFEYKIKELDETFFVLFKQIDLKRKNFLKDLNNKKENDFQQKEKILNQIREIVEGEETGTTLQTIKLLQKEWKKTNEIQGFSNPTLWANYNALIDRYYDKRSIHFELKDLDRKKNSHLKEKICEKAEALNDNQNINQAIFILSKLHEEYKHIGPTPKTNEENLWIRFKAASDKVYEKRKEYTEQQKIDIEHKQKQREELLKNVQHFASYSSTKIHDWIEKTKEIQNIQTQWENIKGLSQKNTKKINRDFWNVLKDYYNKKNIFFKSLDNQKKDNLEKKKILLEESENLKNSEDWNEAATRLKEMQKQWKEIGPIPKKYQKTLFKNFIKNCDYFFRQHKQKEQNVYEKNLQEKLSICNKIENMDPSDVNTVSKLIDEYYTIGFVLRKDMGKITERFNKATRSFMGNTSINEGDRIKLRNKIQFVHLKDKTTAQPNTIKIKRKMSFLEYNINLWSINIDRFADSKKAKTLKKDLQNKIDSAKRELEELKKILTFH